MKKRYISIALILLAAFILICALIRYGGGDGEQDSSLSYSITAEDNTEESASGTQSTSQTQSTVTDTLSDTVTDTDTTQDQTTTQKLTQSDKTTAKETEPPITASENTMPQEPPQEQDYKVVNYKDMKAIWISQFDLSSVYSSGGAQRSKTDFTRLMSKILDNVKKNGFNTVFLQTRPYADSFYPSEYYPPSRFTVGKYGNNFEYDPIKVIVDLARDRGFSLHAWINPLRCMTEAEIAYVPDGYAVKKWYNDPATKGRYIVKSGTYLYLNPAYTEVRELILDGAREVVSKYKLDGLHMDDYFYPTVDPAFDHEAYSDYKGAGGTLSLADWRRDNLNRLISSMYSVTKSVNKNALYGISPAGNWNTVYNSQYADIYTWCANGGYIDYICPQVYFGLEHSTYDFVKTSNMWQSFIKTDRVKLIIGMTLGKAKSGVDEYAGSGRLEWTENKDVIKRCIQYTSSLDKCVGVSIFCYQYFYNPLSGSEVNETLTERNNFVPLLKDISWKQ